MLSSIKGYLYLAAALLILCGVGAVYAKGQIDARHAVEVAALKKTVATMQAQAKADAEAARLDTIQAKQDADDLAAAAQLTQDLQDKLNAPTAPCFDDHDAGLVRDLWGPPAPAHPARH
jgi:hypothetical protein